MNSQLWFLGTGGAEPAKDRGNTSLLLKDRDSNALVLVDCSGSPGHAIYRSGNRPELLRDVILTHAHTDHIYALPSLIHGLWLHKPYDKSRALRIHGTQPTLEVARALLAVLGLESKRDPVHIEWCIIDPHTKSPTLNSGDLNFYAFPVTHAGFPTVGLEIRTHSGASVIYSADAQADELVRASLSQSTRILIHDAGGGMTKNAGHAGARDIAALVQGFGIDSVYFVHLPILTDDELGAMTSTLVAAGVVNVVIPNDGDTFFFPT